jgi:hypothetical protein
MKQVLILVSGFTLLFFGTAAAQQNYALTISIAEHSADAQTTSTTRHIVPLVSGRMELSEVSSANRFFVGGTLDVDNNAQSIRAELVICEPKPGKCEPMLKPVLIFAIGEPAILETGSPNSKISVTFEPYYSG